VTNYFSGNPHIFEIVTIPEDPTLMTANQKAPLVLDVASKTMRQSLELAFNNKNKMIREPIFEKLQKGSEELGELFTAKMQSVELDGLLTDVFGENYIDKSVVIQ